MRVINLLYSISLLALYSFKFRKVCLIILNLDDIIQRPRCHIIKSCSIKQVNQINNLM